MTDLLGRLCSIHVNSNICTSINSIIIITRINPEVYQYTSDQSLAEYSDEERKKGRGTYRAPDEHTHARNTHPIAGSMTRRHTREISYLTMASPQAQGGHQGGHQGGDDDTDKRGGKSPKGKAAPTISNGRLNFGKFAAYDISKCMAKVKTVTPSATRANFCLVNFLSTKGQCNTPAHKKGASQHKFSDALKQLRPDFEHKPYRVDKNAKEAKE